MKRFMRSCVATLVALSLTLPFIPATAVQAAATTVAETGQSESKPFTLRVSSSGYGYIEKVDPELVKGDVVIPEKFEGHRIIGIDDGLFKECQITSLTLPDTIMELDVYKFRNCSTLSAIYVGEDNLNYFTDEYGVLYNKEKTQLIYMPPMAAVSEYTVPDGVEQICLYGMYQNQNLTKLILPDSVKQIDYGAAMECKALSEVVFGSGLECLDEKSFANCTMLRKADLPEGLTEIGAYAFSDCALEQIKLPASLKILDSGAFAYCPNVKTVSVPTGIETYGGAIFKECVGLEEAVIEEGNTAVGCTKYFYSNMFLDCTALKKVILPQTLTTIPAGAFSGCTALETVTFPQGLKRIEKDAFSVCRALKDITIPNGVEYIGEGAFSACDALTSVVIPPSVKVVESHAFSNYSMTHLEVQAELEYVGLRAFPFLDQLEAINKEDEIYYLQVGSDPYYAILRVDDRELTEYEFNEDTKVIAGGAFQNCDAIESITVPSRILSIGSYAFSECSSLREINIGTDGPVGSGMKIGPYAFSSNHALTQVNLGSNVTSVGDYAFRNCSSLEILEFPDSVTELGYDIVDKCSSLKKLVFGNGLTQLESDWIYNQTQLTELVLGDDLGCRAFWNMAFFEEASGLENLTYNIWENGKYLPTKTNPYAYFMGVVDTSIPRLELHPDTKIIAPMVLYGHPTLTEVVLPEGLQQIWYGAFWNCNLLESIEIPDTVTLIGDNTFLRCFALKTAKLSKNITTIYDDTFGMCSSLTEIVIPEGVTVIQTEAFRKCSSLKTISLPQSLTQIGSSAFEQCSLLTDFQIPANVTTIGDKAFSGCSRLSGLVLPDGVTQIGSGAFMRCGFEKIVIPDTVTSIGDGAFVDAYCGTEPVFIGKGLTTLGVGAFKGANHNGFLVHEENDCFVNDDDGTLYNKDMSVLIVANPHLQKNYVVADTVKWIEEGAFYECIFPKVTIHDEVESIGREAFRESSIRSVKLPKGLKRLENGTFAYCSFLRSVALPKTLEYIGHDVFMCSGIGYMAIPAGVKYIGSEAFCFVSMSDIEFMGPPPLIMPDAFDQTTTIAFYYTEETDWDETVQLNYSGNLTWKNQCRDHDYVQEVTQKPGCTTMGTMNFACTRCSDCFTIPIPEAGHDWITETKEPTCTQSGESLRYCSRCDISPMLALLPAKGHQSGDWVVVTQATEDNAGVEERRCTVCNELLSSREIPKLEKFVGGALGDNLTWKLSLDTGILTISGEGNMMDGTKIAMPWDGYADQISKVILEEGVTSIGSYAFDQIEGITAVTLPESLTTVGKYAFFGCSGLKQIHLSENVTTLGVHAFSYCTALTEMTIPHTVTEIPDNLFVCCYDLQSVTLHEGITAIGDSAFFGCSALTALTIPQGVPKLGERCLYKCAALTELTIPASVSEIGSFALYNCTGLQKITFEGDAPAIAADAFKGVTAVAVHPAAWAEEVKANYGGTITWKSAQVSVTQPTISLKYPTLTFENVILLNVYYDAADLQDVIEMGLVTYKTQVEQLTVDNADAVIAGYVWNETEGLYSSTTQGIAAKDMGDEIWFAVYAKLIDGSYTYSKLVSYSPETYAYAQLTTGDPDMRSMVVAMLNYGAAAQEYFGYNTDAPVNGALTEDQLAMAEEYRSDMVATVESPTAEKQGDLVDNGGYTGRYPTVSFEGAFSINYYFTPSQKPVGNVTMYYWNQEAYDANEILTADNATAAIIMEGDAQYHAVVEGIAAKDLDKGVYVCFVYSDGTTEYSSGVLAYSIGIYCATQANTNTPTATLAKATAVYGYYAKNLLGT